MFNYFLIIAITYWYYNDNLFSCGLDDELNVMNK